MNIDKRISTDEAQDRLLKIADDLIAHEEHLEVLTNLQTDFRARLSAIDRYSADPGEQRRESSLKTTLQQLHDGVSSRDGVWHPTELAPVMDHPGIARTRERIEELQAERDALNAFLQRWPARDGKFEYTGR